MIYTKLIQRCKHWINTGDCWNPEFLLLVSFATRILIIPGWLRWSTGNLQVPFLVNYILSGMPRKCPTVQRPSLTFSRKTHSAGDESQVAFPALSLQALNTCRVDVSAFYRCQRWKIQALIYGNTLQLIISWSVFQTKHNHYKWKFNCLKSH